MQRLAKRDVGTVEDLRNILLRGLGRMLVAFQIIH